jgi:hypothetical protein
VRRWTTCTAPTWSAWYCSGHARQDAGPDSDYDIAVFLKTLPDRWAELDRLAVQGVRFFDETGAMFEAKPYLTSAYDDHSPLMHEVRREGRDI